MATYAPTTTSGTTGVFEHTIGFSYARKDDVKVYIDDVLIVRGSGATQWVFSTSGTKITFTSPNEPQTGETLVIRRVTDVSDLAVTYTAGSGFVHTDINLAMNQLLYSVDELQVPGFEKTVTLAAALADDVTTAHNLGGIPTRVVVWLQCTSANLNYASGDWTIKMNPPGIFVDSTSINYNASAIALWKLPNAISGVVSTIDDTKWNVVVRAWR